MKGRNIVSKIAFIYGVILAICVPLLLSLTTYAAEETSKEQQNPIMTFIGAIVFIVLWIVISIMLIGGTTYFGTRIGIFNAVIGDIILAFIISLFVTGLIMAVLKWLLDIIWILLIVAAIIIGLILLLCLIGFIYAKSNLSVTDMNPGNENFHQNQTDPSAAQVQQQFAQPQKKMAVIRPMDIQHVGKKYPVGETPVVIGRDSSMCVIVYEKDTVGVSGCHCTVSFDAVTNDFIITDMGSTYGTTLMNGIKLDPNAPYRLHSGDSFCVGNGANVVKVELI